MKKAIYGIVSLFVIGVFLYVSFGTPVSSDTYTIQKRQETLSSDPAMYSKIDWTKTPVKGPDKERWYFEKWHQPYGNVLTPEFLDAKWEEVRKIPSEQDLGVKVENSWQAKGPYGMVNKDNPSTKYSGRVLDLDIAAPYLRVASASGGLWSFWLIFPFLMSGNVTSPAIGTVATDPTNENVILIGTGEYWQRGGTGLWRSENNGTDWTHINVVPAPYASFRVRFSSSDHNVVHYSTDAGYYRSDDNGVTFTRYLTGTISDFSVAPNNNNVIFAGKWGDGVYKSTDNGSSWNKLGSILPAANVGRISVWAFNSSICYVAIAKDSDNSLLGVYKTINGGTTWTDKTPGENYMGGQGWYDNVITVSPSNSDIVLVGGVTLMRSINGGDSWTRMDTPDLHVDHHAFVWTADGNRVWNGNDGGFAYSDDQGATWSTAGNLMPITQYVNFSVGHNADNNTIFGGSQDNGFSGTTNGGTNWNFTFGGDGGGVSIDPNDGTRIFGTLGVYGGNWAWRVHRSYDRGWTWDNGNGLQDGIDPSGQWFNKIRNDQVSPIYLYLNSGNFVYKSTDNGDNWNKMNGGGFGMEIYNLNVSRYSGSISGPVVYACLAAPGSNFAGNQLRVCEDGATWGERATGFPTNVWVRGVACKPGSVDIAYALMNGYGSTQKVFKTTNRGVSWTDITGNLPNVAMGDLVAHPDDDNLLYLGTEMGCYRTTNGGTSWHRWNNGLPEAVIVTEMSYLDNRTVDGTFHIAIATYGNGIWTREISGDDPSGVDDQSEVPKAFALEQNYPNPFNPSTVIRFNLPEQTTVHLRVYDITGREVVTLVDSEMRAGIHEVEFIPKNLASGTYIYRLETPKFTDTKKMVLVK